MAKQTKKRFRKSKRKLKRTNIKSRKNCMRGGYRGTITYPDNDINGYANYKGQISVERNIPHGQGEMKWTNDDVYNGQWHFGKRNGSGTMKYHNETKYTGEWKNNKKDGNGSMHYPNGKVAKGKWVNDDPTGEFIMKWPVKDNLLASEIQINADELDDFEVDDGVSDADTEKNLQL